MFWDGKQWKGYMYVKFSTNKCYNEWFKSIRPILNLIFKYKPKKNVELHDIVKNDILSFGVLKSY
jgi:hypothetical protein